MSRLLTALTIVASVALALVILRLEEAVEPLWAEARTFSLALMWTARWIDVFAQLLLLISVIVAVSYLLSEVGRGWPSSTPTR